MRKKISYKITSLVFAVLVICFVIGFYVLAWTEPSIAPPAGNAPAPLNVSINGQVKEGGLLLGNSSGVTNGLIVRYGNVGIGTASPSERLDVGGDIVASGSICANGGSSCIGALNEYSQNITVEGTIYINCGAGEYPYSCGTKKSTLPAENPDSGGCYLEISNQRCVIWIHADGGFDSSWRGYCYCR